MKKKWLGATALSLAAVTLAAGLGVFNAQTNAAEAPKERTVAIADFELFDHIFNISDSYGNVTVEGYITQSKADDPNNIDGRSLEVYSEGTVAEFWAAYHRWSGFPAAFSYDVMTSTITEGDYGFNWKHLAGLSIDVNNVNPFALQVSMFMMSENGFPYNYGTMKVEAESKATLTTPVNRYFMQHEFNDTVRYIVVLVDYDTQVYSEADLEGLRREGFIEEGDLYMPPMKVYFDNLKAQVNENDIFDKNGAVIVNKKFESASEILNFNQSADLQFVRETGHNYVKEADNEWNTRNWWFGTGSALYYNTNEKYVHEGNVGSLEWRINPTTQGKFTESGFFYNPLQSCAFGDLMTGFTVVGEYLNYFNFSKLKEGNVKICVDVYNACGYDKEVAFGIHDYGGVSNEEKYEFPYSYGTRGMTDVWQRLPAGEWTTLEITDFSHLDLSQGIARLRLNTSLLDVTRPVKFYVNNLRIEYAETLA